MATPSAIEIPRLDSGAGGLREKFNHALTDAVERGEVAQVTQLLRSGASVDSKDNDYGTTILMMAAAEGQDAIVDTLLEAGSNVNLTDKHKRTALMMAASKGHDRIVARLLAAEASLEAASDIGNTALTYAVSKPGNTTVVRALVDAGANTAFADRHGTTPLIVASRLGDPELVSVLLATDAGASTVNTKDRWQCSPVMWAAKFGLAKSPRDSAAVIRLLASHGGDVNTVDKSATPALRAAASEFRVDAGMALICTGADVMATPTPTGGGGGDGSDQATTALAVLAAHPNAEWLGVLRFAGALLERFSFHSTEVKAAQADLKAAPPVARPAYYFLTRRPERLKPQQIQVFLRACVEDEAVGALKLLFTTGVDLGQDIQLTNGTVLSPLAYATQLHGDGSHTVRFISAALRGEWALRDRYFVSRDVRVITRRASVVEQAHDAKTSGYVSLEFSADDEATKKEHEVLTTLGALRPQSGQLTNAALLHLPPVIEVFDCRLDTEGRPSHAHRPDRPWCLVREAEEDTLEEFMHARAASLSDADRFAIARGLLESVAFVHERGVIHGAIHPSNILRYWDGRLRLSSFSHSASVGSRTTPHFDFRFLPPEVASAVVVAEATDGGAPRCIAAERDDLWAVGVFLFGLFSRGRWVLTGENTPQVECLVPTLGPKATTTSETTGGGGGGGGGGAGSGAGGGAAAAAVATLDSSSEPSKEDTQRRAALRLLCASPEVNFPEDMSADAKTLLTALLQPGSDTSHVRAVHMLALPLWGRYGISSGNGAAPTSAPSSRRGSLLTMSGGVPHDAHEAALRERDEMIRERDAIIAARTSSLTQAEDRLRASQKELEMVRSEVDTLRQALAEGNIPEPAFRTRDTPVGRTAREAELETHKAALLKYSIELETRMSEHSAKSQLTLLNALVNKNMSSTMQQAFAKWRAMAVRAAAAGAGAGVGAGRGPTSPAGAAVATTPTSSTTMYLYQDEVGATQGPFRSTQMRVWWMESYFNKSTMVAVASSNPSFVPISTMFPDTDTAFVV